jgi:hypothetical protein
VRPPVAGDLDVPGRVAVDQPVPGGQVQRCAQGGTKVVERRRGLRPALAVRDVGDGREGRAQQRTIEVAEPELAEMRDEHEFHVAGVVQPGGGPDPGARVKPVPQPSLHGPAVTGAAACAVGHAFVAGLTGRGLRREATAADTLRATQQVRRRAVEIPAAVAALGQLRTVLLQPFPLAVTASAPFEDHTWS